MPLTRNLYDLDEVESALLYSLNPSNASTFSSQSAFWCWELEVSEESEIAYKTLNRAWLYWGGGYNPRCLRDDLPLKQKHALVAEAIRYAQERQRTALPLLERTASMKYRPTRTPPATNAATVERRATRSLVCEEPMRAWWISLDSAMRQYHPVDALWLLQAAWFEFKGVNLWPALKAMARGGANIQMIHDAFLESPCEDERLYQTAVVLYLCYSSAERQKKEKEEEEGKEGKEGKEEGEGEEGKEEGKEEKEEEEEKEEKEEGEWPSIEPGRRQSRLYAIPPGALTTATIRGSLPRKYTSMRDLQDLDLSMGCSFWQRVLAEISATCLEGGGVAYPSDEAKEACYDRYFPDDIPDEWSAADREKSHGRCCGSLDQSGLAPTVARYRSERVCQKAWEWGTRLWTALITSNPL